MKTPFLAASALVLLPFATATEPTPVTVRPVAAPTPPPVLVGTPTKLRAAAEAIAPAAQGTLYSIGDPSDDEQYYLELINRARANPAAEGVRLATTTDLDVLSAYSSFSVDLAMLQSEFAAIAARPPLALNAQLTQAARGHTTDLYTNAFQGHVGTDGRTLGQRATDAGYAWTSLGENVYSYADSVWHGHAGFEVDWGGSAATGGMQSPRGHRDNIHNDFREVGIGVINGSNTVGSSTVGPQLVTQDFGSSSQYFVTGVAYYDLDGDSFYDPGEGVGGLTVEVSGASYYAVTAASGGYAVPVPFAAATRTVTFTGPDLARTFNVAVPEKQNAKADCTATYAAPVVTGSLTPPTSVATTYSFTSLPGATGYEWQQTTRSAFANDAADSLARVTATTTGSYSPLATDVRYSGTGAYHLAHPTTDTQLLTYPDTILVGPSASIAFRSRLGLATSYQSALLEISLNGGATWEAIYTQKGTNDSGETTFQAHSVSLAAYAGKSVRLRFAYRVGGSYYPQTDAGRGWYIDEITATNLSALGGAATSAVPSGRSFAFTPASAGTYLLAVRPLTPGRTWPFGPYLEVNASAIPPFTTWATQQETAASLPAGTIADHPTEDYNNDGIPNLAAYGLGLSAVTPAVLPAPFVADGRLRLSYQRDLTRTDATVTPQISTDLKTWYAVGAAGAPTGFADTLLSSNGSVQTRESSVPLTSGTRFFLRLGITRP